ncbi:MAG TPA: peptidoglycan synthetase [Bacteroides sp.]|nr:peptidoglycan synthetase [Bacteroides sp.]
MNIHFIAIGGAVMHNLAIALHNKGCVVSGSDDEIFEPSRSRLDAHGLLPEKNGWDPDRIHPGIDAVILGMHARKSNPELKKAQELGIQVYSFPEYLYEQSQNKKRVVIGGSHGKTTITAMVMHVLRDQQMDFDYLVGSGIQGFETMVKITEDAPLIIIEGDEYLSSAIDPRPKFHLYYPHVVLLSGIAWDHMNVFPTFEEYKKQFRKFLEIITGGGKVFYYDGDPVLAEVIDASHWCLLKIPYREHPYRVDSGRFVLHTKYGEVPLTLFGRHNMQNIQGARLICNDLGVEDHDFYDSIQTFRGAERRQQLLANGNNRAVYLDFAHAPSKVKATVSAFREMYGEQQLVACLELHTYSSLNMEFIPQYNGTLDEADLAMVYYNPAVVKHKKLPPLSPEEVKKQFGRKDLHLYNDAATLEHDLKALRENSCVLLIMTSGNFSGIDLETLAREVVGE